MYTISREINRRGNIVLKVNDTELKNSLSLNSEISPQKEIERFGQNLENNKNYIIIGSGNGVLLEYLIKHKLNSRFYIIEVFDEIDYEESYKIKLKESNVNFFHNSKLNYIEISTAIRNSLGMQFDILLHPNYERLENNLIEPILEKIKMGITTATINKNTEKYFMYEWLSEPILNLSLTKEASSVFEYKQYFNDKPFILVSSGPSLIENIDFIIQNKEKAYIVASGSAVNGLLNNGINPDFVTVIDSSKINYTAHFKDSKYKGPLITAGTTNHSILKNHDGKLLITNLSQDTVTKETRSEIITIPTVPSVALYSLLLTHFLGASEVYLVGQDLALANGKYYASGVNEHSNMKNLGKIIEVENNHNEKVQTTLPLASTLESFNYIVSHIQKNNNKMKIYNLSMNGAKISGVPFKSTKEIKLEKTIDKAWINNIPQKNNTNYYYTKEFLDKIINCKSLVDEIVIKVDKMNTNAVTLKDLEKLLKLVKKLRSNDILETHVLNMIYSTTKTINNMFEFGFEDSFKSNAERVEMLNKIKFFVHYIQDYFEGLEKFDAWSVID